MTTDLVPTPPRVPTRQGAELETYASLEYFLRKRLERLGQTALDITPETARFYGIDLEEGYSLQGVLEDGKIRLVVTDENGYQFYDDDRIITPQGETFANFEAYQQSLPAMPEVETEIAPLEIAEAAYTSLPYNEQPAAFLGKPQSVYFEQKILRTLPLELRQQYANIPMAEFWQKYQDYRAEQTVAAEADREEILSAFADVFPDFQTGHFEYILGQLETNEDYQTEFLTMIQSQGHTEQTEKLLKMMFPQITDEQIGLIFNEGGLDTDLEPTEFYRRQEINQMLGQPVNTTYLISDYMEKFNFTWEQAESYLAERVEAEGAIRWFSQEAINEFWDTEATEQAITDWYTKYQGIAPGAHLEQMMRWRTGDPLAAAPWYEKLASAFTAGVGDMMSSISGALEWAGLGDEIFGWDLSESGAELQKYGVSESLQGLGWSILRSLPMSLSLIPLSLGGAVIGGSVAAAAGAGRIVQWISGAIGAVAMSRPIESLLEVGSSYTDLVEMYGEDVAREKAWDIFKSNMVLSGWDALQMLTALAPVPKAFSNIVKNSKLFQTAKIGSKVVLVGLSEGGEEVYQEYLQRMAKGEAFAWDDEMRSVFIVGGIMGVGLGFGGDVISNITNKVKTNLTPEMQEKLDNLIAQAQKQGLTDTVAQLQALQVMAQENEDAAGAIQQAINQASQEIEKPPRPSVEELQVEQAKVNEILKADASEQLANMLEKTGWTPTNYSDIDVSTFVEITGSQPLPNMVTSDFEKVKAESAARMFAKQFGYANANELRVAINNITAAKMKSEAIDTQLEIRQEPKAKPTAVKEDWQMTQAEAIAEDEAAARKGYAGHPGFMPDFTKRRSGTIAGHRQSVEDALQEGKPVPPEVLKDYPELAEKYPQAQAAVAKTEKFPQNVLTNILKSIGTKQGMAARIAAFTGESYNSLMKLSKEEIQRRWDTEYVKDVERARAYISEAINQARGEEPSLIKYKPTITPQESLPEMTEAEKQSSTSIYGNPELTPKQIDKTLELFGQYVEGRSAQDAWELTQELRRETRAQRAEAMKGRMQELILEGKSTKEAYDQAIKETMAGELPKVTTDYVSDLTERMKEALYSKVYNTLKDEQYEMVSTIDALNNALQGKPIPRKLGTGTPAFPKGGSAWLRLQRVFGSQPLTFEAIETISEQGKDLEDIVEGIFHEVGRPPIPVDEKTANYLRSLSTDIIEKPKTLPGMEPNKPQSIVIRKLKEAGLGILDIGNFMRANKASFDFSFWRQQAPLILNNKTTFMVANVEAWKAMWSQKAAEASWTRITHDPLYHIYEQTGLDFLRPLTLPKGTAQWKGVEEYGYLTAERPIPRFTEKLPWVKFSQRSFVTGTNVHNWRIFRQHYQAMLKVSERIASGRIKLKKGETFSIEKEMHDYGKLLEALTGRVGLGKAAPLAPALSSLIFAPRLALARLVTPKYLIDSNPRVRAEAWKNLTTFVGGFGGIVLLGAMLGWWEVDYDPRSANFMSIRIGNTRIDPWGGYKQYVVFLARCIEGTGISAVTGAEWDVDKIGSIDYFLSSKASPMARILLDFWTGTTFVGDEVELTNGKQWLERIAPFAIWDFYEAMQENPIVGWSTLLPNLVGFSVSTYTGDWPLNFEKLGLPKFSDNLTYGIIEPIYDVRDFWADTISGFTGVDPATLTEDKGFPPYIQAMVQAARIKDYLSLLPNQSLVSINADPEKGATFLQYYEMWQEREKIVASGDEDALKAFDADERTRNAYMGNMSQRQYALLVEYHSITDKKEQREFLKEHPELSVNPRHEWLKTHAIENAQLAIWGQADVYTQAAYDKAMALIKEYDIPDSAVAEYLPPAELAKPYFERLETVSQWGANSWEDKLLRAQNPELNEWLGLGTIDTPIASLELKVKYRTQFDLLSAYSDINSPDYIEDEVARKEAINALRTTVLEGEIEFRDIERRVEAIEAGSIYVPTPEPIINNHIEYMRIIDTEGRGASSAEAMLYRIDNPDYNEWRMNEAIWGDSALKPIDESKIPIWRITAQYRAEDAAYDALTNTEERAEYLATHENYRKDRRRREALQLSRPDGMRFPESQVENYVSYYELSIRGYRRERFLIDNPEFALAMSELKGIQIPDAVDVPAEGYDIIYENWGEQFEKLNGFSDMTSEYYIEDIAERQQARNDLFASDADFRKDYRRWEAYGKKAEDGTRFTEEQVNQYAEYYELSLKGYRRERFLIENPEFADAMHLINGMDLPDASKVPAVQYDDIYDQYRDDYERLEGLSDINSIHYIEDVNERKLTRERLFYDTNGKLTAFGKANVRREAYGKFVPDKYVDRYVDYYTIVLEGIPADWPTDRLGNSLTWYGDDWYLQEHPSFYQAVYIDLLGHEEVDFSRVPSREVFDKYAEYSQLKTREQRLNYRKKNKDLDEWLLLTGKVSVPARGTRTSGSLTATETAIEKTMEYIQTLRD